jgi:hypothetical protein
MTIRVTEWKNSIGRPAGREGRSLFVPGLKCQALSLQIPSWYLALGNNQTPNSNYQINTKHQVTNHQTVWSFGHWSIGDYLVFGAWLLVILSLCGVRSF